MNELITLTATITFLTGAEKWVGFPIHNNIRLSFWFPEGKPSTFSEIQLMGEALGFEGTHLVRIILPAVGFLSGRLEVGSEFRMGTFPHEVLSGKVTSIETQE